MKILRMENIITNRVSDKAFIARMDKELLNSTTKNPKTSIKSWKGFV
jgi:hypothetical protein